MMSIRQYYAIYFSFRTIRWNLIHKIQKLLTKLKYDSVALETYVRNMNRQDNNSLYHILNFDMLSIMILYLPRNDNWPFLQESKIIINVKASSIEKVIFIKYFEWILRKYIRDLPLNLLNMNF